MPRLRAVTALVLIASLTVPFGAAMAQEARDPGLPPEYYAVYVFLQCLGDKLKFLPEDFEDREQRNTTAEILTFENFASGGLSPVTVGDFATLVVQVTLADLGVNALNFKSKKIKTTYFYESVDENGRLKRVKLGKDKPQFKNGVALSVLQIPVKTVEKFDDSPGTAQRAPGDGRALSGRIVAEMKSLPDFPENSLMFIATGLYWASLNGRVDARTGIPEPPAAALHVPGLR